jgi:hypothetical protein
MLLASTGPSGTVTTGKWVGNATQFFLQDVSGGLPLNSANTIATVTVYLTGCSSPGDQWATSGSNINNTNTGNVGIGNANPIFKLDVNGELNATGVRINGAPITGGAVSSVFGRTGAVVQQNNDYTWAQINKSTSSLADLQTRSAGDLNAGTVPIGRLGASGTPDATTFLRGDNTWATVTGGSSPWATSGTNVYYNSGNVGIGGSPTYPLDVSAGAQPSGGVTYGVRLQQTLTENTNNFGNSTALYINPTFVDGMAVGNTHNALVTTNGNVGFGVAATGAGLDVQNPSVANGPAVAYGTRFQQTINAAGNNSNSVAVLINPNFNDGVAYGTTHTGLAVTSGNVGIGTTTPSNKLHIVSGTDAETGMLHLDTGIHGGTSFGVGGTTNNESYFSMGVYRAGQYFDRFGVSRFGHVYFQPDNNAYGNVGIGTTTPAYKLDVAGSVNATGLCIADVCKANWSEVGVSQWATSGANISYSGGNVGIGVGNSAPAAKLDVVQANGGAFRALSGDASSYVHIQLGRTAADGTIGVAAGTGQFAVDATAGDVVLRTEDPTKRLLMTNGPGAAVLAVSGGKVGVGKSNPTEALDVVGNISATGNIAAKYQDVAEWVPSTQKLAAGTVVILDPSRPNHVLASTSSYDTAVAGVISARPGITLGDAGEGKALVATTGRVKVRVDASRGPIRIGDLLVTSDVEGLAMKSEPVMLGGRRMHSPGTIIGKALETLESGTGEILVLLSLQ